MEREIEIPKELITEELYEMMEESTTESPSGEEETAEKQESDKMVPLAALQRERERVRALKHDAEEAGKIVKRLLEETGLGSAQELEARLNELSLQKHMKEKGVDEEVARMFQEQQEEIRNLKKLQKRGENDAELRILRETPFYSDIDEVLDTVYEYAENKGLSLKEAYRALFGEKRAEKLCGDAREEALAIAKSRQDKKIPALSSAGGAGGNEKAAAQLSPEELGWAKMAGLTPDEYAKYKK